MCEVVFERVEAIQRIDGSGSGSGSGSGGEEVVLSSSIIKGVCYYL